MPITYNEAGIEYSTSVYFYNGNFTKNITETKFAGIEDIKPLILNIYDNKSEFEAVIETKPNNIFVQETVAIFQESDTTYNDSSLTYNASSQVYGGSEYGSRIGQVPSQIDTFKPIITIIN